MLALGTVGCQQFDDVEPFAPATEEEIVADGYTFMTINEFKEEYFYAHTPEPGSKVVSYTIEDKVALKGKVISSDELGNTYRSLFIQDASGAENGGIEIKVGKGSLYTVYKPGQMLYIKADGLELGNYRWTLSLGGKSSDEKYSNGYIDIQTTIDEKLLAGEIVGFNRADTLVVNADNVANIIDNDTKYIGTLVRLEDITSLWTTEGGKVENYYFSNSDIYPSYLDGDYTTRIYADEGLPTTWAYSYDNTSYYGSSLFVYDNVWSADDNRDGGKTRDAAFIARTSGYSRFALNEIPRHNQVVDLTAILVKYCSSGGGFTKYQLTLNTDDDVVVAQ